MELTNIRKIYFSPSFEMIRLSATDVLKNSPSVPGEDEDENQGIWIG